MEVDIMILNVLDYTDKKTGELKSRMSFIFADKEYFQDTEKFLGFGEVSLFYNKSIRNKIPKSAIGKSLKAKIQTRGSFRNPMKSYSNIESIVVDGKSIDLL